MTIERPDLARRFGPAEVAAVWAGQVYSIFVWLVVLSGLSGFRPAFVRLIPAYWGLASAQWAGLSAFGSTLTALSRWRGGKVINQDLECKAAPAGAGRDEPGAPPSVPAVERDGGRPATALPHDDLARARALSFEQEVRRVTALTAN